MHEGSDEGTCLSHLALPHSASVNAEKFEGWAQPCDIHQWQEHISHPPEPSKMGWDGHQSDSHPVANSQAFQARIHGESSHDAWATPSVRDEAIGTYDSLYASNGPDQGTDASTIRQPNLLPPTGTLPSTSQQAKLAVLSGSNSSVHPTTPHNARLSSFDLNSGNTVPAKPPPFQFADQLRSASVLSATSADEGVQWGSDPVQYSFASSYTSANSNSLLNGWSSQQAGSISTQGTSSTHPWTATACSSSSQVSSSSVNMTAGPSASPQRTGPIRLRPDDPKGVKFGDVASKEVYLENGDSGKERLSSRKPHRSTPHSGDEETQNATGNLNFPSHHTDSDVAATWDVHFPRSNDKIKSKSKPNIQKIVVPKSALRNSERGDSQSQVRHLCPHPRCGKHFSTGGHARRHSRIHSSEQRYECPHPTCPATFTRRDNCQQHQRNSHKRILDSLEQ